MMATLMSTLIAITSTVGDDGPQRYLALGDSYTIGESVPVEGRWPVQLAGQLRARGVAIGEPTIVAKTGWTTDELSAAIDDAQADGRLDPPYDLVSLLIGVNNQYRGRAAAEYRGEFDALLERAIGFAGGDPKRVFVLSIPDWGATTFGASSGRHVAQVARELDDYNAIAKQRAQARGVAFVDITSISREPAAATEFLADDGLHPSSAQYGRWAEAALPVVEALVSRAR